MEIHLPLSGENGDLYRISPIINFQTKKNKYSKASDKVESLVIQANERKPILKCKRYN